MRAFLAERRQLPAGGGAELSVLLTLPVRRVAHYDTVLRALIDATPDHKKKRAPLYDARRAAAALAKACDRQINVAKLQQIDRCVDGG